MRIYLVGPDDKIKEYIYTYASSAWQPGNLDSAGFGSAQGSKYLWAVTDARKLSVVGFVKTEGVLSEAFDSGNSSGWLFKDF